MEYIDRAIVTEIKEFLKETYKNPQDYLFVDEQNTLPSYFAKGNVTDLVLDIFSGVCSYVVSVADVEGWDLKVTLLPLIKRNNA